MALNKECQRRIALVEGGSVSKTTNFLYRSSTSVDLSLSAPLCHYACGEGRKASVILIRIRSSVSEEMGGLLESLTRRARDASAHFQAVSSEMNKLKHTNLIVLRAVSP